MCRREIQAWSPSDAGAITPAFLPPQAFPLALTMATISSRVESVSAPPGTLNEEAQPVVTPLDAHSHVLVVGASRGVCLEWVECVRYEDGHRCGGVGVPATPGGGAIFG